MRLRSTYILCRDNIDKIRGITCARGRDGCVVGGWLDALHAILEHLGTINFLKEDANALIENVPEIFRMQDSFKTSDAIGDGIFERKKSLLNKMESVINLYESMGFDDKEKIGIDIKLPKCNDFSDFKKYIDELDFILYKCPFFKVDGEDLKFESVDVGSMWLCFLVAGVGTSVVLNNIAAFIDKCLTIKSHKITIDQQIVQLDSMKMEQEEKEIVLKGLNKLFEKQVKDAISDLESTTGITLADGEERDVVSRAFEKTNALLDKGMQIYTTIDSSDEVKALFKPLETKYLSVSEGLKLLEKSEEGE